MTSRVTFAEGGENSNYCKWERGNILNASQFYQPCGVCLWPAPLGRNSIHDLFGTELAMIFSFHVGLTDSVMQRMHFFFCQCQFDIFLPPHCQIYYFNIRKKVLSRAINFGRQCHFNIWLDCHKFKKFPCLIIPMSTKCQNLRKK
jgi:hypothetical protein